VPGLFFDSGKYEIISRGNLKLKKSADEK